MRKRSYGIDRSPYTAVAWCLCGWRDVHHDAQAARESLARHQNDVHSVPMSVTTRERPRVGSK